MNDEEGWYWPPNSRKAHFYRDHRSLCGRWAVLVIVQYDPEGDIPSPDNCKACFDKRQKELDR